MGEILSMELKNDLEYIYKNTGDLLNLLEEKDFKNEKKEINEIIDKVKFTLEDIGGTLQKDIFNCDYLITKIKVDKVL